EPTEENYTTIASLLNSNVTSENGYFGWKNDKDKFSFTKVYEVSFGITPSDAKLVVKDSEGNVLASDDNVYTVPNGTYTYEVSKDEYATKTAEFTIDGSNKSINVKLAKSSSLWDGESVDTTWYNETDSSFKIANNNQLAGLLKLVADGNDFIGKTITLSDNLDLNDKAWAGIGTFNGTFDGAGYIVKNLNGNLFKNLGEKAIVVNASINGNGSLVDTNNGRVENSYSLSDNNLVLVNNGTVKNCYVKSSKVVVKEGTAAVDSYYMQENVYTEEDLSNSKIADLLNKNVNSENSLYYSWDVSNKETKLFKLSDTTFNITGKGQDTSKAVITLYDSDKNEITTDSFKNYKVSDTKYKLSSGTYTYKITCTGYEDETGTIKITKADVQKDIELNALYKTTINADPSDATIVVKDSEGKEIVANEDGSYYLTNGTYTYEVSKDKYWISKETFTVDSKDQEISVKLVAVYNVTFNVTPASAKGQTIEVYTSDNELVTAKSDKTYELRDGKYTYKAKAVGYEDVTGEFEVVDKDLEISISFAIPYDTSWYDDTKDTFEITNDKQLAGLAALVNGINSDPVTFEGKTIVLANDIVVDETMSNFLPIGDKTNKFKGNFNGSNHTVKISIDSPTSDYVGLFGYINGAKIYDVTVDGSVSANKYKAGLVGYVENSTVENCINKATITGKDTVSAGIVGYIKKSVMNNCINEGNVTGKTSTAGIIGTAADSTITNCINKGTITGSSNVSGGVVGALTSNSTMDYCVNEGEVNGTQYVGGVVANFSGGTSVLNSYNKGAVKGTSNSSRYVAGVVGYTYKWGGTGTVANCYNLGEISTLGATKVAGVAAYLFSSITLQNCYNAGNVNGGIQIAPGSDAKNCYYLGEDDSSSAKTQEEFENGTVAKLLNKAVTATNKYSLWKVDENKTTTFANKYVELSFGVTPSEATVVLKDSEGNVVSPIEEGIFSYDKETLKSGETYTYEVSSETYATKTGEITYNGEPTEVNVDLEYIRTEVSFKSNVDDLKVLLYNKNDKKLIEANENGIYELLPGDYYYYASSEKYPTVIKEFTVEIVKEAAKMEIDVQMTSGYKVLFDSNATTKLKVVIKNSQGYEIPLSDDWCTYELLPGTYTYTAYADGFETIQGEDCTFTVTDSDLDTISLSMNRIYDVDWYSTDKTEFTITTKDQLVGLANIVNGKTLNISKDNFAGKTIKLGNDIALNSAELFSKDENGDVTVSGEPEVFTSIKSFQGTFDGQNYTISGLYNASLFDSIENGTLKNRKVSGCMKNVGNGIVNRCTSGLIENCIS
ncbi:MAG: hypothetical protein ACI3VR_01280, partial [Intestinibacter sp.]|uniref:hypothetical protein n=1 Tax=Intestinibacter sp. TaxID=1965304 RepID=UPI003F13A7C6